MKVPFFNLKYTNHLIDEDLKKIYSRLNDFTYVGGEEISLFEKQFADYIRINHAISCANGTDALEIVLRALNLTSTDEVIVPALTCFATVEAIINAGGKPIFVDVNPDCYTLDSKHLLSAITPKTKAIIPVHLYGQTADMKSILKIANKIPVIEDCSHAHGLWVEKHHVGTRSTAGIFSFYPTKNLGALGDAGIITTNNKILAEKCRILANHGQKEKDIHVSIGKNSRMDTVQAAILSAKLKHLDHLTKERRKNAEQYYQQLSSAIKVPFKDSNHVFHQFVIQAERRNDLINYLNSQGIATAIHYPYAVNTFHFFHEGTHQKTCPVAENLVKNILSLPIYPGISTQQIARVSKEINKFYR